MVPSTPYSGFFAIRQRHRPRFRGFYANFVTLAVLVAACGPVGGGLTEEDVRVQGWNNFQTAVASDRNYDIYWLGREFEAGGKIFRGPEANSPGEGIGEVESGGLSMYYMADKAALQLVLYSRAAWKQTQEIRRSGAQPKRSEVKDVQVAGHAGKLITVFNESGFVASGDVNLQVLSIEFGETVVEATTRAILPATATARQPNPLVDEATFLSVMQGLRLYPEQSKRLGGVLVET